MANWFDALLGVAGNIMAQGEHELIQRGWFGRNFPPPGSASPGQEPVAEVPSGRDIHGNALGGEPWPSAPDFLGLPVQVEDRRNPTELRGLRDWLASPVAPTPPIQSHPTPDHGQER